MEVSFRIGDDLWVEQFAQISMPKQLRKQRRVEGERLRAALGQRCVALIHERADVPEQQRARERRAGGGLHLDEPDLAARHLAHEAHQGGDVEDVLQALAHRLEHDREAAVPARDRQQLSSSLPLLPQRRAAARLAAGEQQGAGCALTEPGREHGRRAEFVSDDLLDLVGIEQGKARRRRVVGIGHPDHDAVIGVHRLDVHAAVPLAQPRGDR